MTLVRKLRSVDALATRSVTSASRKARSSLLQTREFWQRRAHRSLTVEDARQITENVAGFFRTLEEWDSAEGEVQCAA